MSNIRLDTIISGGVPLKVPDELRVNTLTVTNTDDYSSTLGTASLVISGSFKADKSLVAGGNMIFNTPSGSSSSAISLGTSSGTDDKSLLLAGFGGTDVSGNRGAYIKLSGAAVNSGDVLIGTPSTFRLRTGTSGGADALTVSSSGVVTINATDVSGDSNSGALVVKGGLGVQGTITASGGINMSTTSALTAGSVSVNDATEINTFAGALRITNTATSTAVTQGSLIVDGGAGIAGPIVAGSLATFQNIVKITDTTVSTGVTSGALQVSGGLAVASTAYIGGVVSILSNVASTTPSTGALVITGGLGISGALRSASNASFTSNLTINSPSSSSVYINYNTALTGTHVGYIDFARNGVLEGNIAVSDNTAGRPMEINSTVTNGIALATGGGNVGIGSNPTSRKLYIAGTATVASTLVSDSTTTGALIVSGGIGASGQITCVDVVATTINGTLVGAGIAQPNVTSLGTLTGLNVAGVVTVTATDLAISASSGAIKVTGGIGIGGASYFASSITADALVNRSATFVFGTSATGQGDSGLSRALLKDTGNVLVVNNLGDFTGGTRIDGSTVYISGNLRQGALSTDVRIVSFAAVSAYAYGYANTGLGDAYQFGFNSFNNGSWNVPVNTLGTSRVVYGSNMLSVYTGAIGIAPTTQHISVAGNTGTTFYTPTRLEAIVTISANTPSLSSGSGALVVTGGVGIGEKLYVNGATILGSTLDITGMQTNYNRVIVTHTQNSNSSITGAIVVTGGIGIGFNATIGGNLSVAGITTLNGNMSIAGVMTLLDNTPSNAPTTGALVVNGGLGIVRNVNIGETLGVIGESTFANKVFVSDLTDTIASNAGALVVAGGTGIGGNAIIGGSVSVAGTLGVTGAVAFVSSFTLGTILHINDNGSHVIQSASPGLRVAALNDVKGSQYANSFSLYTLGNSLSPITDANHEVLQISNSGSDAYVMLSRSSGTGTLRKLILQSGGTNSGQLSLNTDGTVSLPLAKTIQATANASSASGGALNISSGDMIMGSGYMFFSSSMSVNTPTVTSRSVGTRIVLRPTIDTTTSDSAIGIGSGGAVWFASGSATGSHSFYAGNTLLFGIDAGGNATAQGGMTLGVSQTGSRLTIAKGASDAIRIAPGSADGAPITIAYAFDTTYAATAIDGEIWYTGRNLFGQGTTTFGIGTDGPSGQKTALWIDNARNVYLTSTKNSNVVGEGALVVSGGASLGGTLRIGGDIHIGGTLYGTVTSTSANFSDLTDSTSTSTGTVTIGGGLGIGKNMHAGGIIRIYSTAVANGSGTGALVVGGGAHISGNIYSAGLLRITNTSVSTGIDSGALVLSGGCGVGGDIFASGSLNLVTNGAGIAFSSGRIYKAVTDGIRFVSPSSSVGFYFRNAADDATLLSLVDVGPMTVDMQISVTSAGDATSASSGSIITTGGVGIAKSLFVGSNVRSSTLTISSTATTLATMTHSFDNAYAISSLTLNPLLSVGNTTCIAIGKEQSTKNLTQFGFYNAGTGSNENAFTIGFTNANRLFNVFASGNVAIGSVTQPTSKLHVAGKGTFTDVLYLTSGVASTTVSDGALVVTGGAGISGDLRVGGAVAFTGAITASSGTFSGNVVISATTETNAIGQGSLVIAGGFSAGKSVRVATELYVIGGFYGAFGTLTGDLFVSSVTQATDSNVGSLVTLGGMSVAKDTFIHGDLTLSSSSILTCAYGRFNEIINSSAPNNGTLIVTGGLGVGLNVNVGGICRIHNVTQSIDVSSGALVVDGGAGIAKNLWVGGTIVTKDIENLSDARLKTVTREVSGESNGTGVVSKIASLRPVHYYWKNDVTEKECVGVLAQELLQVFPDLVSTNEDGIMSVDYRGLSMYMLSALQSVIKKMIRN